MLRTRMGGPSAEQARLSALRAYEILDTPADRDFDDIAGLAAQLCGTPIAAISLVDADRQWFKAKVGLDVCQTSRDTSFCARTMYGDDVVQIADARLDADFADNPFVLGEPYIRFYAGAPLVAPGGQPLGTLCVVDRKPGRLTDLQRKGLLVLARHVMVQLELRQYARRMAAANRRLREAEQLRDEFLARVTHELRTPLTSIHGYLEILDEPDLPAETSARFLTTIRRNCERLVTLVDDMLLAAQLRTQAVGLDRQYADLSALVCAAAEQNRALAENKGLTISAQTAGEVPAHVDVARLAQAVDRLVLNAVKFTSDGNIVISAAVRDGRTTLEVRDTGVGFPTEERDRLFAPFRRASTAERAEVQGVGLGLSIVKAIVDGHDGTVTIDSAPGHGTTVTITL
jgi:signal transduction histidine kinase